MTPNPPTIKARRRRLVGRYGLGGLLLTLSIACGLLAYHSTSVRRSRLASQQIQRIGSRVSFNETLGPFDYGGFRKGTTRITRYLSPQIFAVDFRDTSADDSDLAVLASLPKLQYVHLDGTGVTDAGLEKLVGCVTLKYLGLDDTAVSESAFRRLQARIPGLATNRVFRAAEFDRLVDETMGGVDSDVDVGIVIDP